MSTIPPATASVTVEPNMVTRAQNGDPNAFAVLFEAHKPKIYAICLRMTNNMAEAEDLTQDAFIHVFRKLSTFRGDSAFSTWLYRIAVNTVLMHFRKRTSPQISIDQSNTQDSSLPKREYGRVDEQLSGCVDRLALARAINELPTGYRMIFLLHEVKGFEHKEIARLLHCSVGNSKSQLHKAKLRMRKLLTPGRYARHRSPALLRKNQAASNSVASRTVQPAAEAAASATTKTARGRHGFNTLQSLPLSKLAQLQQKESSRSSRSAKASIEIPLSSLQQETALLLESMS